MNEVLRKDANLIIDASIRAVLPDAAVKKALTNININGNVVLVSVGKAGYQMAKVASDILGDQISDGIIITKYGHCREKIKNIKSVEAGHPVPDENSIRGTMEAIKIVSDLNKNDTVVFLLSGGGSSLFELPFIDLEEMKNITKQLLACGADIKEINTIRKRLSRVKGGRFAEICSPAKVYSIILSDVIGDQPDMIASGPTCNDTTTCQDAERIIKKYNISLSNDANKYIKMETPKELDNVSTMLTGSVIELCTAAQQECERLGYRAILLTNRLSCQAKEAGFFLSSILQTYKDCKESIAFIAGGETIVKLIGDGKGGRNQELALAASLGISGENGAAIFSVGSDGTDGPTDAAGGYVDEFTYDKLLEHGINVYDVLNNNDAYNALEKIDGLIVTGPTGTNVNDVAVALLKR